MPRATARTVSIVLVNFRGASDTLTAVEHLESLDWPADQLEIVVVDFEAAVLKEAFDADGWSKRQQDDLDPLLRLAALLQCSLGTQPGELAERCRERLPALFRDPGKFRREMDRQSTDLG